MSVLAIVLIVILLIALLGGGFTGYRGGPYLGTGPYGGIGLIVILLIIVLLATNGRL